MWKKILFWVLAVIITLATAVYQRMTGPTYPKSYSFEYQNKDYKFQLPRSQNGIDDALISLEIDNATINGKIFYRRFKSGSEMDTIHFHRENNQLVAWLPKQPAAGKLEYGLILENENKEQLFETPENIVIRFKDNVPAFVLIPHILLIFAAMLLSNLTGFYAISRINSYKFYALLTLLLFLTGGMIMGPVVQKYAFDAYWTGFPFGKDLTDNKALIAFILWIIAWLGNRKKDRAYLVIIAAIANLVIAFIPHSLRGSELDYSSGEIKTGIIYLVSWLN